MKIAPTACVQDIGRYAAIIDVRSPAEYAEDHIPGAISCPVLDNQQRAEIGTLYKQSRFEAKKRGAAMVAANIATHLSNTFIDKPKDWRPLVYCWRGGQRSGAMTTVLRQVGWDAAQLEGGYKAYRHSVVGALMQVPQRFSYVVISGSTGTGKTRFLKALRAHGKQVVDLEALASHKGSVLGLVPNDVQPTQKMFESRLLECLHQFDPADVVYIEAESRKIGRLQLPDTLVERMRDAQVVILKAPLAARVEFLLRDYDYFTRDVEALEERLAALRPLRGNEVVDQWCSLVRRSEWPQFVEEILREHYDPLYLRSQRARMTGQGDWQTLDIDSLSDVAINVLAANFCRKSHANSKIKGA